MGIRTPKNATKSSKKDLQVGDLVQSGSAIGLITSIGYYYIGVTWTSGSDCKHYLVEIEREFFVREGTCWVIECSKIDVRLPEVAESDLIRHMARELSHEIDNEILREIEGSIKNVAI